MNELEKLRHRLTNVNKNTKEYRMSVIEAKNLLSEIDSLIAQVSATQIDNTLKESATEQSPMIKILDGGNF